MTVGHNTHFYAIDRAHVCALGGVLKLNAMKQVAMVGHRVGVHAQLLAAFQQVVELDRAVQQREVAVNVKMDEVGHGALPGTWIAGRRTTPP